MCVRECRSNVDLLGAKGGGKTYAQSELTRFDPERNRGPWPTAESVGESSFAPE